MSNPGSVTVLLSNIRCDDETAIEKFFNRFFDRLKHVARKRLSVRDRKVFDDEDLAAWAIYTFQKCVREGMYPNISNREDVWKFLVSILERKSVDHIRREHAKKRGGGQVRGESIFEGKDQSRMIERMFSLEEHAIGMVELVDVLDAIVRRLKDPELGKILTAKLAGHTNREIAEASGKSIASINRKLRLLRRIIVEDKDIGCIAAE